MGPEEAKESAGHHHVATPDLVLSDKGSVGAASPAEPASAALRTARADSETDNILRDKLPL